MPNLTVNGHSVTVDDSFDKLSPQEQNATVDEIAKSLPSEKPSGVVAGLKEGLSNALHGPAETLKTFGGADTSTLEKGAQAIAPKDYKRGDIVPEGGHWYDPTSYNWKNVPQMLAENVPQMAESMVAAKVGAKIHPIAGLVAGALPFVMNSLGDTAKTAAVTRTGESNAEANTADKLRAAGTVAAQSIPQMLGINRLVNPGSVAAVGVRGAAQAAAKGVATTGIEGATGAAQNALGQAGMTVGTEGGLKVDPAQVAEGGVGNAILGGAMQTPKMLSNIAAAKKYAKFGGDNAASTERVANLIKEAADGESLKSTKVGYDATRQTHEDIIARMNAAASATPQTTESARVLSRAAKGRELTDADHAQLEQHSTPDVASLARDAHVAAMLKGEGDFSNGPGTFTGGIANSVGKHIRAIQNPAGAAVSAGIGATIGGAHAASLFAYSPETLGAIGAAYAGMRGIDALTGNRSPANKFVNKFGTDAPTTTPPTSPTQPPQAPATTSVPPSGPRPPMQPWGAPQAAPGPNNALPSGPWGLKPPMLNPTGPQVAPPPLTPTPPPAPAAAPINPTALQAQVKAALQMYSSRSKFDAKQQKQDDGAGIPSFLPERIPSFLPKRDEPVAPAAAPAPEAPLELPAKFSRMLGRTDPSPPADIPSFLKSEPKSSPPAEQQAVAEPSISDLVARLGARTAAMAPPAAITKTKAGEVKATPQEPPLALQNNPYPQKVVDNTRDPIGTRTAQKLDGAGGLPFDKPSPHDHVNSTYDLTNEYVPLQSHEMPGKHMTSKEFAAHAVDTEHAKFTDAEGVYDQAKADQYHNIVEHAHGKRDQLLKELSQSSISADDTPALKALADQLHHIRRGETARAAIYHYTSMMSPALRTKVLKRLDSGFVHKMWSKEN
jgi:hypothetical protein